MIPAFYHIAEADGCEVIRSGMFLSNGRAYFYKEQCCAPHHREKCGSVKFGAPKVPFIISYSSKSEVVLFNQFGCDGGVAH